MPKIKTNDGRLHLGEPAHVNSRPDGLTESLATEWAKALDFISVNFEPQKKGASKLLGISAAGKPMQMDDIIAKYSALMCYTKAAHTVDANLSEPQYAHKAAPATKANRKFDTHWKVYITEPDEWRNTATAILRLTKNNNPGISMFIRDSARASYNQGGIPIIPGSTQKYTDTQWWAKIQQNFSAWDSALSLDPTVQSINGLQLDTGKIFKPCIGMVENAFGALDHTLPTEQQWTSLADNVWKNQIDGWTPWVYNKMNADYGTPEWNKFREYGVPAAYILDRGSLVYWQGGREGTVPGWKTGEFRQTCYNPKIGTPMYQPATDWRSLVDVESGCLVKYYTAGVVIFNPHTDGRSVDIGQGSPIQVDPSTGQILQMKVSYERVF